MAQKKRNGKLLIKVILIALAAVVTVAVILTIISAKTLRSTYEKLIEDFPLDEVFLQDGDLYIKVDDQDGAFTSQLYPIGDKTFGRKGGFAKIIFGENCLTVDGVTCKKL